MIQVHLRVRLHPVGFPFLKNIHFALEQQIYQHILPNLLRNNTRVRLYGSGPAVLWLLAQTVSVISHLFKQHTIALLLDRSSILTGLIEESGFICSM